MIKTIKIEGMSCGHCEGRVKNALSELKGVTIIKVSAVEDMAELEVTEAVTDAALKEAIEDAGYDVISIQ